MSSKGWSASSSKEFRWTRTLPLEIRLRNWATTAQRTASPRHCRTSRRRVFVKLLQTMAFIYIIQKLSSQSSFYNLSLINFRSLIKSSPSTDLLRQKSKSDQNLTSNDDIVDSLIMKRSMSGSRISQMNAVMPEVNIEIILQRCCEVWTFENPDFWVQI